MAKEPAVMTELYYLLPELKQNYSTEKKHILYIAKMQRQRYMRWKGMHRWIDIRQYCHCLDRIV